jgi:hypothetical protein
LLLLLLLLLELLKLLLDIFLFLRSFVLNLLISWIIDFIDILLIIIFLSFFMMEVLILVFALHRTTHSDSTFILVFQDPLRLLTLLLLGECVPRILSLHSLLRVVFSLDRLLL